jgi:hypothetical protein
MRRADQHIFQEERKRRRTCVLPSTVTEGKTEKKREEEKERASPICCALSKTIIFCFRDGRSPSRIRAASIVFFPCVRRQALRFLADDKNQIMPVA